jgi:hypothetical protein
VCGSGGGGCIVAREDEGGSCWAGGAGAATVVVVVMDEETPLGSPNAGAFIAEWMVVGLIRIMIQSDLGGGLKGSKGEEFGGKARGGAGIAFSWVLRGRLTDDGRRSLFFYATFMSYSWYI